MDYKILQQQFDAIAEEMDADIIVFSGPIKSPYDDYFIDECRCKKIRKNVLLVFTSHP